MTTSPAQEITFNGQSSIIAITWSPANRPKIGDIYRLLDGRKIHIRAIWDDGVVCEDRVILTRTEFLQLSKIGPVRVFHSRA